MEVQQRWNKSAELIRKQNDNISMKRDRITRQVIKEYPFLMGWGDHGRRLIRENVDFRMSERYRQNTKQNR